MRALASHLATREGGWEFKIQNSKFYCLYFTEQP